MSDPIGKINYNNGGSVVGKEKLESVNIKNIATDAYNTVKKVGEQREALMSSIKDAVTGNNTNIDITINNTKTKIDISTGAGALILDDYLQELSTVEQAAAQFVSAENKAQKQIHSITGQG